MLRPLSSMKCQALGFMQLHMLSCGIPHNNTEWFSLFPFYR